ncbi:Autophagy-related protein 17 [Rhizina undulata]
MVPSPSPPFPSPTPETSSASVDLTTWFLDAKRSLSSVALCSRANSLVDFARQALHDATVVSARCIFLKNALQDQLVFARRINQMMHGQRESSRVEFEKTLAELDNADNRLNQTLEVLRNSIVDPAFSPPPTPSVSASGPTASADGGGGSGVLESDEELKDPVRTLHDFVEDEGIENLKSKLRHSIDQVQESHDAFLATLTSFDTHLSHLTTTLTSLQPPTPAPIHPYLLTLEDHAESMAHLLDSLTRHYDRCSAALRTSPLDPAPSTTTTDLYTVLARDAAQVEDVVSELKDRLSEMENIYSEVSCIHEGLLDADFQIVEAVGHFEEFGARLSGFLDVRRDFEGRQEELRSEMEERLADLWGLGEFYEGFAGAYDEMVVEVARRRGVAVRMEAVAREAMGRLEALFEEDLQEREAFRNTQGEHLPIDIWPGLLDPPIRYVFTKEGRELPDIAKEVIERALRKTQGRMGV